MHRFSLDLVWKLWNGGRPCHTNLLKGPYNTFIIRNRHYLLIFCWVSSTTPSSLLSYLWLFGYRFRLTDISLPSVGGIRVPRDAHGWTFIDRLFGDRYSTADRFSGLSRSTDTTRVFSTGRSLLRSWTGIGVSDIARPYTTYKSAVVTAVTVSKIITVILIQATSTRLRLGPGLCKMYQNDKYGTNNCTPKWEENFVIVNFYRLN